MNNNKKIMVQTLNTRRTAISTVTMETNRIILPLLASPSKVAGGGITMPSGMTSLNSSEVRKLLTTGERMLAILMFSFSDTLRTGLFPVERGREEEAVTPRFWGP